jgi:3,4-dehydroadipyl-CoA semialdehyde dehydrogenase
MQGVFVRLANYLSGQWVEGDGQGIELKDPVTAVTLARVSSEGVDLFAGLQFAREQGNTGLQKFSYQQRAEKLAEIAEVLIKHRQDYYDIALKNSGSTLADAAFDIDGAIFTLKSFSRAGKSLGQNYHLIDGGQVALSKAGEFQGQHFMQPLSGAAVLINAFNFPAWGLWEKAAPALLSGVPVVVKPATPTAWLTQRMVADVVEAGILPQGALNIICGSARDLLNHVEANDVVSFTGSAETASIIRTHPKIISDSVRVNIEADSVNSLIIGPQQSAGDDEFKLAIREIVKEMTIKSGQKCTAIRRIFVPAVMAGELVEALKAKLGSISVGNPRDESMRMGPLVSEAQKQAFYAGLELLKNDAEVVFGDDADFLPDDAGSDESAFVQPTLLLCEDGVNAEVAHDVEVFGPLATIFPYQDTGDLISMLRLGKGSLVASLYTGDKQFAATMIPEMAKWHGRIMVVDSEIGTSHTGHGNVMPNCLHGGPGRAGGGEELAGLRALALYHRRYVVQGGSQLLELLSSKAADCSLLSA